MKKNVGRADAIIRIIIAVALLYFMDNLDSSLQLALGIIAAALIFTALNGFCLLYVPFKISTRKKRTIDR